MAALDDDFFSGDPDFERSIFHADWRKPTANSTFLYLSNFKVDSGFSDSTVDNGISFAERVRPRVFGFKTDFRDNVTAQTEEAVEDVDRGSQNSESGSLFDLEFLLKGWELGHRDATSLFFFVSVLSATYAYVVCGFIVSYTLVSGITFLKVVDHLVEKHRSFLRVVWDGSFVGLRKLSGFILMRWTVRDAMAQVMGILFFGEIEEQYRFFKMFLMLKFLPFVNVPPWVIGHELESSYFIAFWVLSDLILGLLLAVDYWVAIVDSRRGGREILAEGYHLVLLLFGPAFKIRLLEAVVCGWCGGWILRRMFGVFPTLVVQSLMEVYFLVAWLVFYLAARHRNDTSLGRTFGRRELEGFLEAAM